MKIIQEPKKARELVRQISAELNNKHDFALRIISDFQERADKDLRTRRREYQHSQDFYILRYQIFMMWMQYNRHQGQWTQVREAMYKIRDLQNPSQQMVGKKPPSAASIQVSPAGNKKQLDVNARRQDILNLAPTVGYAAAEGCSNPVKELDAVFAVISITEDQMTTGDNSADPNISQSVTAFTKTSSSASTGAAQQEEQIFENKQSPEYQQQLEPHDELLEIEPYGIEEEQREQEDQSQPVSTSFQFFSFSTRFRLR